MVCYRPEKYSVCVGLIKESAHIGGFLMINSFVNVTTFGQFISCSFNLGADGTLADKRITAQEDCVVQPAVYEKTLTPERIAEYIAQGKKVENLSKAVETENIRVNSLYAFAKELSAVSQIDNNEPIIIYVPTALLQELVSGRIKFYIAETAPETTYYSQFELDLWKQVMPMIKDNFDRLVFKDINSCKKNISNTAVQQDRVNIYKSMYNLMLESFRTEKANRAVNKPQAPKNEVAF